MQWSKKKGYEWPFLGRTVTPALAARSKPSPKMLYGAEEKSEPYAADHPGLAVRRTRRSALKHPEAVGPILEHRYLRAMLAVPGCRPVLPIAAYVAAPAWAAVRVEPGKMPRISVADTVTNNVTRRANVGLGVAWIAALSAGLL